MYRLCSSFLIQKNNQTHPFHLVDPSPFPISMSLGVLALTFGGVLLLHSYKLGSFLFVLGITILLYIMYFWWNSIIREGTYESQHTEEVQVGLRYGMILFILSEVMFFFAFFWAFFHSSLSPSFDCGGIFPPDGIEILTPWEIPLLNTILLLTSGVSITWAHHSIILGSRKNTFIGLFLTILLAFVFTLLQILEYQTAPFFISDGIYGSTFFLATGFHGFHVFIGSFFLIVCFFRHLCFQLTTEHHFGFEAAAWYWHFVDIVWLFLFVSIYWWGC